MHQDENRSILAVYCKRIYNHFSLIDMSSGKLRKVQGGIKNRKGQMGSYKYGKYCADRVDSGN